MKLIYIYLKLLTFAYIYSHLYPHIIITLLYPINTSLRIAFRVVIVFFFRLKVFPPNSYTHLLISVWITY